MRALAFSIAFAGIMVAAGLAVSGRLTIHAGADGAVWVADNWRGTVLTCGYESIVGRGYCTRRYPGKAEVDP
jgi:hypothetical protein